MKQLTSYNRVAGYLNKIFDMLAVFAITVVVALLSIILEFALKSVVRRALSDKN